MSQVAFEFDLDDGGEPTYSVSELGELINGVLRRRFLDGVWVRGEIQGWNERGPHAYFRLVEEVERPDGSTGKAQVNVQFFANIRMRLRPMLQKNRLRLADGLKVRIFGHLDFFAPSGSLGLKMSGLDPRFTLGDLAMQRDEVVRRLVAAGLYDANRAREMALAPLRVGVVTSTSGAAWADFVHELERSSLGFQVRVIDVRVQGDQAVDMVTRAIRTLGRHGDLDVVAVVRGGGARSELATFDHEAIATAIATCPLPVLTGLGHEIDRSVADEVAHASLKTPTACAAALVERVLQFRLRSETAWSGVSTIGWWPRSNGPTGGCSSEPPVSARPGCRCSSAPIGGSPRPPTPSVAPRRGSTARSVTSTPSPPGSACSIRCTSWPGAGASPAAPTGGWCATPTSWLPATRWSPRSPPARPAAPSRRSPHECVEGAGRPRVCR